MKILGILLIILVQNSLGRIHRLQIKNDYRKYIPLSTFGFYKGGTLDVRLIKFHPEPFNESAVFGFSLDKTLSDAMNQYLDTHQENCLLTSSIDRYPTEEVVYFTMDFKAKLLRVNCSRKLQLLHFTSNETKLENPSKRPTSKLSDASLFNVRRRRAASEKTDRKDNGKVCNKNQIPMTIETTPDGKFLSTNFEMHVVTERGEGLYNLYFHNCPNYNFRPPVGLNFVIEITETNFNNYLSAGEIPLPTLYFMMALLFFLSGCFWVFILSKSKHPVFKIHYLMALLVYLKSISLLFHGINYHFIQTKGEHVAAWAILYYITHLLKGSVLFIVIVLVGTGWTFIKPILSEKDKKIFMIVIPLQVLANVAEIIIEESEEGYVEHRTWRDVFILVDLVCCGAILFPVVWSIRHLQEASHTDGKAAMNLRKLKLFRHFYIMIVCYIYFTRIIVYLLKITVPFQYEWLDEMFREMATYVFFVLTGYKFRPASANPYFQLTVDENEDEEMDIVISETGFTEGLKKVNRIEKACNDTAEEETDYLVLGYSKS